MFGFFTKKKNKGFAEKDYLIIHGAHHKAGTNWFNHIFKEIAKKFCWKYEAGTVRKRWPDEDTNIFLHYQSHFDFSKLDDYRGTHLVRDPRDMVISGYFYHLWCNEKWCLKPRERLGGRSYREMINELDQEQGILFEMTNKHGTFHKTASDMENWNYENPRIMELKFEELVGDYGIFNEIFDHYGFNDKEKKSALNIISKHTFKNLTGRDVGEEDKQHHFRKGVTGDWRNYFTPLHKSYFKDHYQGLLEKLGYEKNVNW